MESILTYRPMPTNSGYSITYPFCILHTFLRTSHQQDPFEMSKSYARTSFFSQIDLLVALIWRNQLYPLIYLLLILALEKCSPFISFHENTKVIWTMHVIFVKTILPVDQVFLLFATVEALLPLEWFFNQLINGIFHAF